MSKISPHFILFLISAVLLNSCAVGPNFHSPTAPNTQSYTYKQPYKTVHTQGKTQYFDLGKPIPAKWWALFHSPALNQLVCAGLAHNPTLESAQAALRQAQENLNAEAGIALFPAVNGNLSATRQRAFTTPISIGPNTNATRLYNLYNASVNISYNLDFFGGARRELESLLAQVDYQHFQYEAACLTLTANIVTTAISEASLREQIQTLNKLIALQEKALGVVKKQFQLGSESQATVLAQETQLAQTRALLPPLEKRLAELRNALAVLTGQLPSQSNQLPLFTLDSLHLPTRLPVSLPSTLIHQRPDIRASEALLQSASAKIGVATSALLPQFTLTGSYGSTSSFSNALFKANSAVWGLGAQALQPIFKGGALRAQRRGAIAAYDQAAAQYRQTVLQALQNVGDSLHALQFDAQTLQAQVHAENAAKNTWRLTQKQYALCAIDYLTLLNAQQQYQQTSIVRTQAQAARYADTAALFQALGGGW